MTWRYGTDQLNVFLMALSFVLLILYSFTRVPVLSVLELALLIVLFFRMFSKNPEKRRNENAVFLKAYRPVKDWWDGLRAQFRDRKTHRYFSCPSCGQKARVPKGKGKICITCPKCKQEYIRQSYPAEHVPVKNPVRLYLKFPETSKNLLSR